MIRPPLYCIVLLALVTLVTAPAVWCAPVPFAAIRSEQVHWEGYSLTPYSDGVNGWSAGIGHSLVAHGEPIAARYTAAEVERWFVRDVAAAVSACRAGIRGFDDLPHDAQLVGIALAFSCGRAGFLRFHRFRAALSARSYRSAATALAASRWAAQVGRARSAHCINLLSSLHP